MSGGFPLSLTVVVETTDDVEAVYIPSTDPVSSISKALEGMTGMPQAQQLLLHNGQPLNPQATLQAAGLADGDILTLRQRQAAPAAPQAPGGAQGAGQLPPQLQQLLHSLQNDPTALSRLPPPVVEAVRRGDANALMEYMQRMEADRRAIDELNINEFDPEAQARIAERIRQEQVESNYEAAMEETPEAFIAVDMLYVKMEVNKVPVVAFVDSGAQMSIISEKTAEACGVLRLIDRRFEGVAMGVGMGKILGKIHAVTVNIGGQHLPMSLSVMADQNMDFLFGLDMLRRYRCMIDLKANALRFNTAPEVSLPFLTGSDLPRRLSSLRSEASAGAEAGAASGARSASAPGTQIVPTADPGAGAPIPGSGSGAAQPPAAASQPRAPAPGPAAPAAAGGGSAAQHAPSGAGQPAGGAVERLMALGFPRAACAEALQACGGSEEQAAALLFDPGFS